MDIEALIEQREKIKSAHAGMLGYRKFIAEGHHSDFTYPPAKHHELMIDALEDLVLGDEWDALLIMAPPGSAKSTYGSVQFSTWVWSIRPHWNILCCSNTDALAKNFARRRRSVCEMQEWQTLSETSLDPSQINISEFGNLAGGQVFARGAGSSIAGIRCNLLISDDLIASFEEANSPGQLDKLWEWYGTDARTRLVPDGKEVMIMTRWSRQDPIGRILKRMEEGEEPKRVKVLRLPMLCDDPENDPMGRELNEPLWPEWFSNAQIADNINHPLRWPALYQQVPIDATGTWVDHQYVQIINASQVPKNVRHICAMDLALSNKSGDYTVIVIAAIDEDRNIYIVDMHRDQVNVSQTLRRVSAMCKQYHPNYVLIDDDPAAKVFVESMKEYARGTGDPVQLRPMPIRGNDKEYRAAPIRDLFMQNRVFIVQSGWTTEMMREIANFPPKSKTEHDDIVDCLGLIGRDMGMQASPHSNDMPAPQPIEGAYTVDAAGKMFTAKTLDDMWADQPKSGRFEKLRI